MAEANAAPDLAAARESVLAQLTRAVEMRLHRGDLVNLAASPGLSRVAQAAAEAVLGQGVLLPPGWSLEWLKDAQERIPVAQAEPVDRVIAGVRAGAVADERQRIGTALTVEASRVADVPADAIRNDAYWAGRVEGVLSARSLAAGSVPVATPPVCGHQIWAPHYVITRHPDGSVTTAPCPGPAATPIEPADPTYGRIDPDVQRAVDALEPESIGSRVAMENTLQARRDAATTPQPVTCRHGRVGGCGLDGINESASPVPAERPEPRGVGGHAPGCDGWRPPTALGFGQSVPSRCIPGCPHAAQPEGR